MKKIISCLALAFILFACSKEEAVVPLDPESSIEMRGGLTVTTDEATYILPFGAISGGSVSQGGGGKNVTERGVCYSTSPNPTIDDETVPSGSSSGAFTSIISGLDGGTTYYVRAYANKIEKSKGKKGTTTTTTTYGNEVSFTTLTPVYGTVDDSDGNTYTTIEIGTQVWMMENLKTTKYRDGTLIPNVTDGGTWAGLSEGAYCNYLNNEANVATYGRLYNWFAVDDAHNIAPEGWHVATTDEWRTLAEYVGKITGDNNAGGKLKEAGFEHWDPPYVIGQEGNNSSGFTALGSGERRVLSGNAPFLRMKKRGNWWTANGPGENYADFIYLASVSEAIMGGSIGGQGSDNHDKKCGYSVRCVKD